MSNTIHWMVEHGLGWVPFLGMCAMSEEQKSGVRNAVVRLVEAGIIGLVVMYGVTERTSAEIVNAKQDIQELKVALNDLTKTVIKLQVTLAAQQRP